MEISVTKNNVHIVDSYQVKHPVTMLAILSRTQAEHPDCNTWQRSYESLVREWRGHNLLYTLHLFSSHTKDVDLDYPAKWYTEIIYFVLSVIYTLFV